jgi:hypothetical protein
MWGVPMSNNTKYKTIENVTAEFWRDLQIKYDAIHELSDELKSMQVAGLFTNLTLKELIGSRE